MGHGLSDSDVSGAMILRQSLRSRFGLLFVALLLAIVMPSLLPTGGAADRVFTGFLTLVLLSGLYTVSRRRFQLIVGTLLVTPAVLLSWSFEFHPTRTLAIAGYVLASLFLAYLAWLLFLHIISAKRVDANTVFAGISVYLLLGWIFGLIYGLMYLALDSAAFSGAIDLTIRLRSQATYYSFVTLTTLGYGDIAPAAEPVRAIAIFEAITGQLYLVVMIARLVALHIAHAGGSGESPAEVG
jgi:hypothetical protein